MAVYITLLFIKPSLPFLIFHGNIAFKYIGIIHLLFHVWMSSSMVHNKTTDQSTAIKNKKFDYFDVKKSQEIYGTRISARNNDTFALLGTASLFLGLFTLNFHCDL